MIVKMTARTHCIVTLLNAPMKRSNVLACVRILACKNLFYDAMPLWSTSARYLKGSVASSYSWEVVLHGLSSTNGMICCLMLSNSPLRKHKSFGTPCNIMVGLSGNNFSHIWKRPHMWLTKMFLTDFIRLGGSKALLWPNVI